MSDRRILSDADIEWAAIEREKGRSVGAIAQKLGCSSSAVSWHCLKLAADPPKAKPIDPTIKGPTVFQRNGFPVRRFLPHEDETLLQMAKDGARVSAIARALNRRENSIRGRLMTLARHEARLEAHR